MAERVTVSDMMDAREARAQGAAGAAGTVPRRVGGMSVHEYCRSDQADGEH